MSMRGRKHVQYRRSSDRPISAALPIVLGMILLFFLFR